MKRDSKLSGVLHILLHLVELDEPATSDDLSKIMGTNPVVVRRLMAGLRRQGYVESEKGHGGGWTLTCDLHEVTLLDIYETLGSPSLLAIGHRTEAPGCLVEQSVNAVLGETFDEAEQMLLHRLGEVTLASLSADCHERLQARDISLKAKRNSHGV